MAARQIAFAPGAMVGALIAISSASRAQTIQRFPDLPGHGDQASQIALSADGSTIVGSGRMIDNGPSEGFRWTRVSGFERILHAPDFSLHAYGVSADGSVVVGDMPGWRTCSDFPDGSNASGPVTLPARWTAATGAVPLVSFPCPSDGSAFCVSDDGQTIAGAISPQAGWPFTNVQIFRWNANTGIVWNQFEEGTTECYPYLYGNQPRAMSADGHHVAGVATMGYIFPYNTAMVWLGADQPESVFPHLINDCGESIPTAMSAHGERVVGTLRTTQGDQRGFVWSLAGGTLLLPGATEAQCITPDGQVIGGSRPSADGLFQEACLWIADNLDPSGYRALPLADVLTQSGADTSMVDLPNSGTVKCLSANGRTIVFGGGGVWFIARLDECLAISAHPEPRQPCETAAATFSVTDSGRVPLQHQWQWRPDGSSSWYDITDGLNSDPFAGSPIFTAEGSNSREVTVTGIAGAFALGGRREIRATISNSCGVVTSAPAAWNICFADFNCDSAVDFFDYLDFVDAFSSGNAIADFNNDSVIDFFDYLDFVDAFSQGC